MAYNLNPCENFEKTLFNEFQKFLPVKIVIHKFEVEYFELNIEILLETNEVFKFSIPSTAPMNKLEEIFRNEFPEYFI